MGGRARPVGRGLLIGTQLVYRARPILSLAGSWGRGVGKAREGLADVISIHELLTNELLIWYLSHPLIGTQKHHVQRTLNVALCKTGKFI